MAVAAYRFAGVPPRTTVQIERTVANVVAETIGGRIRNNSWRRPIPWSEDPKSRRSAEYVTRLLQYNTPSPIYVHDVTPDGEPAYSSLMLLDGRNRIETLCRFWLGQVAVPLTAVAIGVDPRSEVELTADDMAEEDVLAIAHTITIPFVVFPKDTPELVLRVMAYDLHQIKQPLLFGQEMLNRIDNPLIREVIGPVDHRHWNTFHRFKGPWRAQRGQMMTAWIRIAAMIFDGNLHLNADNPVQCRQWVQFQKHAALPLPDALKEYNTVCDALVDVYTYWQEQRDQRNPDYTGQDKNMVGSLVVFVDVGWMLWRLGCSDEVLAATKGLKYDTIRNHLSISASSTGVDVTRRRRDRLIRIVATILGIPMSQWTWEGKFARKEGTSEEDHTRRADADAEEAAESGRLDELKADGSGAPTATELPPPPKLDAAAEALLADIGPAPALLSTDEGPFELVESEGESGGTPAPPSPPSPVVKKEEADGGAADSPVFDAAAMLVAFSRGASSTP